MVHIPQRRSTADNFAPFQQPLRERFVDKHRRYHRQNFRQITMTFFFFFLGGVEEAVKGVVGRLQIKQHLSHLTVIQLV